MSAARTALQPLFDLARRAGGALVDVIYPPACLVCRRAIAEQGGLCPACWREIAFIERPFCERLGVPFERERSESISEAAVAALSSRQFGNWVGTLNLGLEYEFGSDIDNEFETFVSAQWRYRLRETLEPGVEFYADQFTRGIGPVLTGLVRTGGASKWAWETGLILPLNDTTPDYTFRFLLEYEF